MTLPDITDREHDELALLRRVVGTFRATEQRRRFPVSVHVGRLDGERTSFEVPHVAGGLDPAAAFDLLDSALAGERPTEVDGWLTRPGVPALHDHDLLWMRATLAVLGSRGSSLRSFHTVTRTGWLDVRSGESRVWKRLRIDR